jgi:hypothetical protein
MHLLSRLDRLRAHACRWSSLPLTSVPSATVDDEQTSEWSAESYERDLDEDRKSSARRVLVIVGLGGLIAAAVFGTGIAKASPDVCGSLTVSPTVGTVEQLVMGSIADGYTGRAAGEIIGATVFAACPQFAPVLQRFVNAYTGGGVRV